MQVKLDKKGGIGELSCKVCGQQFQSGINCKLKARLRSIVSVEQTKSTSSKKSIDLSGAVDVYADWVDACDQVAKENGEEPDEGLNSYADLAGGAGGRRNSEMPYDRHVVAAAEGNTVADEYDDDM